MVSLNPSRLVYSLAGELLAGQWNAGTLTDTATRMLPRHPLRARLLARNVGAAFPTKPSFSQLAEFLRGQRNMARVFSGHVGVRQQLRGKRRRQPAGKPTMDLPPLRLRGIVVPPLATQTALARWFGIGVRHLEWLADVTGRNRRQPRGPLRTYRYRWIPKREGLPRLLEIPKARLKQMQRRILEEILRQVPVHVAAHGFCRGRSIVTNAAIHCGHATVLRFDLVDFFPSITSARVFQIFRTLGYPPTVARLLMGICTTQLPADVWDARPGAKPGADFSARQRLITRHLPQGSPTSPSLANLAACRLDRRLTGLAKAAGAVYTRYADDLVFSGGPELVRTARRFEILVAVIAYEEGFAINHRKTRIMRSGVRQKVTGLVVNARPNVTREEFDRLKAILTNCVRTSPATQNRNGVSDFRAHLAGSVAHVTAVNPLRGTKLWKIFREIVWET
jgi:hypothetical protein